MRKYYFIGIVTLFFSSFLFAQTFDMPSISDSRVATNDICTDWQVTNYGTAISTTVAHWTWYGPGCGEGVIRGLWQFDLNPATDHTMLYDNRATVHLFFPTGSAEVHNYVGGATNNQFYVERVTQSWNELTVTWNNQPNVTTVNSILVPSSSTNPSSEDYIIDISNLAYEWICNGEPNYGIKLRMWSESELYRRVSFTNREWADANKRPFLRLQYAKIDATAPDTICMGDNFAINCILTNANNPAQYSYTWTHLNSSTTYTTQSVNMPQHSAGLNTYVVDVTNPWCQSATDTVYIYVVGAGSVTVSAPSTTICNGESVVLTASGASSYQWSHSLGSGTIQTVSPSITTTYTVTGSVSGCTATGEITIQVIDQADATIIPSGPYCENDPAITLTAADGGGFWSGNGITNPALGTFNPAEAGSGTHIVTYGISGQCGDTASIEIIVHDVPFPVATATDESCTGGFDGEVVVNVTGGLPPYSFLWSPLGSGNHTTEMGQGIYTITITDQRGCSQSVNVTLNDPGVPCEITIHHFYVPNVFSPNGDGENDVLYVRGDGIETIEFLVFNRWGQKIFESTSIANGWDGTFNGKPLDAGTFTYSINVYFTNGEVLKDSGNITLVR